MASTYVSQKVSFFLLLSGIVAAGPVFAGSAVIGSVAGSMNATIGGQTLAPNTTVFSGDSLQVNDGVAVVAVEKSSRMVFGGQTTVSFLRDANEVTVLLSHGSVSMYHPPEGVALRIKLGELSVAPAKGFKTLGEVAMVGGSVVITAKEGSLRVEGNGSAQEVAKGKTITLPVRMARAPQGGGSQKLGGGSTALEAGALGAGVTAAILAGIGISRSNDARDAANKADADAKAATAAANAANATALLAGCALDNFNFTLFHGTEPSPFTPPAGSSCPPFK
jgi:hypothetical protein